MSEKEYIYIICSWPKFKLKENIKISYSVLSSIQGFVRNHLHSYLIAIIIRKLY